MIDAEPGRVRIVKGISTENLVMIVIQVGATDYHFEIFIRGRYLRQMYKLSNSGGSLSDSSGNPQLIMD